MEEQFNATPEVVEPEVVTEEVVTPQTDGETPEITTPEKIVQTPEENSKFKELRLKHEKELADKEAEFQARLEAIEKEKAELLPYKQKQEEEQKANALKQFAEANGLTYEEALAIAQEEEEKESLKTQLTEKEQKAKELAEKLAELENDLKFEKLYRSDKEALRTIDPTVDIDNLGESYWKFRMTGLTAEEALSAVRLKEGLIEKAPVIGKVGDSKADQDFMSSEEWDALTPSQQKELLRTKPSKVFEWQSKWLDK